MHPRRRLNIRLLAILVGSACLLGVGIHFLHDVQVKKNSDALLTLARQAEEQDQLREAYRHLKRYLKLRPEQKKSYVDWAVVANKVAVAQDASIQDIDKALRAMEIALREVPSQEGLRHDLIDLSMEYGRFTDARDHLKFLLKEDPNDARLLLMLSRCDIAQGFFDRANHTLFRIVGYDLTTKSFDTIRALDSLYVEAYVTLAELLQTEIESPEIADQVMDHLVEMNPDNYQAYLERGRYLQRRGKRNLAENDIRKAHEQAPQDPDVILAVASLAISGEQFDSARQLLEGGIRRYADNEKMYQLLASLEYRQTNDFSQAIAQVERGLEHLPQSRQLFRYLVNLQFQANQLDKARSSIARMKDLGFTAEYIEYLQTRILITEKKWIKAARQLEEIRPLAVRNQELVNEIDLYLGQCYERSGQSDRALEAYRRAWNADSQLELAKSGVDRMMQATGQSSIALTNPLYRKLKELSGQKQSRRDWEALLAIVDELHQKGQLTDLNQALWHAQIEMYRGNIGAAKEILKKAHSRNAENPDIWTASAMLLRHDPQGGLDAALKQLAVAEAKFGDIFSLRMSRIQLLYGKQDQKYQQQLQATGEDLEKFTLAQQVSLLTQLGASYLAVEDHVRAAQMWERAVDLEPDNLQLQIYLFELARHVKSDARMQRAIGRIEHTLGTQEDPVWKYCEAARLTDTYLRDAQQQEQLEKASRLVSESLKARPTWHKAHSLQGSIYFLQDKLDASIESFQRALELGPPEPVTIRQLVHVLSLKSRFTEAQAALEMLSSRARQTIVPELQAEIGIHSGKVGDALQLARQAVQQDPTSAMKHLWHAHILLRAGKQTEATSAVRQAATLAPDQPAIQLAYVRLLISQKQLQLAREQITAVARRLDHVPRAVFLGKCAELLGDREKAEQYYLQAVQEKPDDLGLARAMAAFYLGSPQPVAENIAKATKYLQQILRDGENDPAAQSVVSWARRTYAQVLAQRGGYPDLQAAMQLLEKNRHLGQLSTADKLAQASILSRRPEPVSRRKAIRLFREVQQLQGLSPRHQAALAELYYRANDWPKAREQMLDLLAREQQQPEYIAMFCRMLLKQDQLDQASHWVGKLAQVSPDSKESGALRVRLLAKQGKVKEAVERAVSGTAKSAQAKDIQDLMATALLLEEIKQYESARAIWEQIVRIDPSKEFALTRFEGFYGDLDDAFVRLARAEKKFSAAAVVPIAVSMIRHRRGAAEQRHLDQVNRLFATALRSGGNIQRVLLEKAAFHELQGELEMEERVYRQLLARKDVTGNVRALVLNNLAYNLAMREKAGDEGKRLIAQAIEIHGPTGSLLDTRGMVSLMQGQTRQAISDLNLAIADDPKPTRFLHLALAQVKNGEMRAAYNSYLEAVKRGLNPEEIPSLEKPLYEKLLRQLDLDKESAGRACRSLLFWHAALVSPKFFRGTTRMKT